ncbi:hypothetical protein E3Q18_01566 [Wallemia mellicola]|uniref:Uncharacterized protein n=1 Tax=Wallemia mellicola TaxID=1708541 RepID=A0A4V4N476_9BASI|nr:hypothetical protein E3Q23_01151 [Wallemia mellicola]TIB92947.1 hypothetical protein E3Q19_01663 [Wallemia mellicola]TIB99347.1 hypothetical protein E3Q18_01566 [Wallemia mellicola]TIC06104.1 hypothetical protein E3Q16_01463 [Wallemia mellicola]TIC13249.1 hypothetical protein E3Q14_01399 [Wallemia mellicola]
MSSLETEVVAGGAAIANEHKNTAAAGGHLAPPNQSGIPTVEQPYDEKYNEKSNEKGVIDPEGHYIQDVDVEGTFPTEEEMATLPRTSESVSEYDAPYQPIYG